MSATATKKGDFAYPPIQDGSKMESGGRTETQTRPPGVNAPGFRGWTLTRRADGWRLSDPHDASRALWRYERPQGTQRGFMYARSGAVPGFDPPDEPHRNAPDWLHEKHHRECRARLARLARIFDEALEANP